MLKQSLIGIFAASLILTGCGESGGSSGPTYTGPTGAVSVTDTNSANTVAGFAASSATSPIMSDLTSDYITPAFTATGASQLTLEPRSLGILSKRFADMAFNSSIATTAKPAGVTDSVTNNCPGGGSYTLYGSVQDASYPFTNPGDLYKITFNNCLISGILTTGSIQFVINSYIGTNNFSATYTFSSFKETYAGDYFIVHGSYTAAVSSATNTVYSITGNSLLFEALYTSVSPDVAQLQYTNFSFVDTLYGTGAIGFDHDFTIASTEIGGSITVDTVTEFVIPSGGTYPTSGQVVVTGANDAKVRLTAQSDGTHVYVEYDIVPVDGVYESNATLLWTDL